MNIEGRITGHTDIELHKYGLKEAEKITRMLLPLEIQTIISSDLKRASQTAAIINSQLRLTLIFDRRLRECSFGSLEGKSAKELIEKHGELLGKQLQDQWNSYDFSKFGGENKAIVLERHLDALKEYASSRHPSPILLVGHTRSLNTLLAHLGYAPNLIQGQYETIEFDSAILQ
ncbi:MAG: histidine phosphatase family protein [Candidatus Wildermuthbacteria bacterium]|nr:histidine phosphatase family protein [Candidatus Wildermuthbacteria bacterium]